jgi:hypothetical protein
LATLRFDAPFDVVSTAKLPEDLGPVFPSLKRRLRLAESSMQKKVLNFLAFAFFVQVALPGETCQAAAQAEKASYPAMAPLDHYLMTDGNSEIALARSAAPASVSDGAEVMVLGPKGYTTSVKELFTT